MAQNNCRGEIETALGRELTSREYGEIGRRAGKLKAALDLAQGDRGHANVIMQNWLNDRETEKAAKSAASASSAASLVKQNAKWDDMGKFSEQNPAAAAKSMFVSSEKAFKGTKDSVGINMDHASEDIQSNLLSQVGKLGPGTIDWAYDKANELNIRQAREALEKGDDPSQFGSHAAKVAAVVKTFQDKQTAQLRAVGIPVGHIADYTGRTFHDPHQLAKAGGANYGSDQAKQNWISKIAPAMDWSRSFGGEFYKAAAADKVKRLGEVYSQFVSQDHLRWNDANTLIKNREIHFLSAKDAHQYAQEFGGSDGYMSAVQSQLGRTAKFAELANEWGPNAKANVSRFLDAKSKSLTENAAPQKAIDDFATAKNKILNQYLPYYTGELNAPQSAVGRWVSEVEGMMSTARIGAVIPKMFMDVGLKANQMARFGSRRTAAYWSGLGKGVHEQLDYMTKSFAGEERQQAVREAAAHGSILLRGAGMPMSDTVTSLAGPGVMGRANMWMLKRSGHNAWTDGMRVNASSDEGYDHWLNKDKPFDRLDPGKQALFKMFGLGDKEWDILRNDAEPVEFARDYNAKGFQPSSIQDMDPEKFRALVGDAASDKQLKYAQNEMFRKYRNLIGELADRTTVSPSSEMQAALRMGIRSDTAMGQLIRPFLALKGFLTNYMKNHVYGGIVGYDDDPMNVGWGQALKNMVTKPVQNAGAWARTARLVATMWGMGYLANFLSDTASGKTPDDPTGDHWADAMTRAFASGALGPMSDALMTQSNAHGNAKWSDYVGDFAGPAISTTGDSLANFADIVKNSIKTATGNETGDDWWENLGKDSSYEFSDVYRSMPMNSMLWTKWATDYMVYDNMMDLMNPGYKDRMRQRLMKERGQSLILDGGQ